MSKFILPLIVLSIIIYSVKKCNIYDSFIEGIKEGLEISVSIFPSIIAIIFSSRILISSRLLDHLLSKFNLFFIPKEILPLIILRPISGNASLSIMINNFKKYGVDSYIGYLSSIIQGSIETTFYIISLYFGSVGIKNTKNTLSIALILNLIGIISALIISKYMT